MRSIRPWQALMLLLLLSPACDEGDAAGAVDEDGSVPMPSGQTLYAQPVADGNTFACATCHALQEPAEDGMRRVGHPIGDAANRPSYKNGQLRELRDAVNSCLDEWMVAEPWGEDDPRWHALRDFLVDQAGEARAQALAFDIVDAPDSLDGGDAVSGMELFERTCATCHGEGASGTERAPSLFGTKLPSQRIAERIRTSGRSDSAVYSGLSGGIMPFWSADRLSDSELRDVVAYAVALGQTEREVVEGGSAGTETRGCSGDHPRVGSRATLEGFAHDVAGTVRVVDDCTLALEDFSFDGGGVNVQIYAGRNGDFDPPTGFSISDNLLGQVFQGGTLTLTLPEGRSLDDLNGVSVWCVPVGVSFGDATFE